MLKDVMVVKCFAMFQPNRQTFASRLVDIYKDTCSIFCRRRCSSNRSYRIQIWVLGFQKLNRLHIYHKHNVMAIHCVVWICASQHFTVSRQLIQVIYSTFTSCCFHHPRYQVRAEVAVRKFHFSDFPTKECTRACALAYLANARKLGTAFDGFYKQAASLKFIPYCVDTSSWIIHTIISHMYMCIHMYSYVYV